MLWLHVHFLDASLWHAEFVYMHLTEEKSHLSQRCHVNVQGCMQIQATEGAVGVQVGVCCLTEATAAVGPAALSVWGANHHLHCLS